MKIIIESICETDSTFEMLQALEQSVRQMRKQLKRGLPSVGMNQVSTKRDKLQVNRFTVTFSH